MVTIELTPDARNRGGGGASRGKVGTGGFGLAGGRGGAAGTASSSLIASNAPVAFGEAASWLWGDPAEELPACCRFPPGERPPLLTCGESRGSPRGFGDGVRRRAAAFCFRSAFELRRSALCSSKSAKPTSMLDLDALRRVEADLLEPELAAVAEEPPTALPDEEAASIQAA